MYRNDLHRYERDTKGVELHLRDAEGRPLNIGDDTFEMVINSNDEVWLVNGDLFDTNKVQFRPIPKTGPMVGEYVIWLGNIQFMGGTFTVDPEELRGKK